MHALAHILFRSLTGLDMSSSAGSTVPDEVSVSDTEVQPVSEEEDSDWVVVYHYFNRKLTYIYTMCASSEASYAAKLPAHDDTSESGLVDPQIEDSYAGLCRLKWVALVYYAIHIISYKAIACVLHSSICSQRRVSPMCHMATL